MNVNRVFSYILVYWDDDGVFVTHFMSHDEHMHDSGSSVTPVHQSVRLVAEGWWVIAGPELLVPQVIDTGPDELVQNVLVYFSTRLWRKRNSSVLKEMNAKLYLIIIIEVHKVDATAQILNRHMQILTFLQV